MKKTILFCLLTSCFSLWAKPKSDSTIDVKPTFSATLTVGKGIHDGDLRYSGAVVTTDSLTKDNLTHAFSGSDVTYSVKVDTKGGKLVKGAINYGDTAVDATVSGDTLFTSTYRIESKAKRYDDIKAEATISYIVDDTLKIDSTFIYQMPKSQTFVLYDIPELPPFEKDSIRINEVDSCELYFVADTKGGNISGWEYEWVKDSIMLIQIDTLTFIEKDTTFVASTDSIFREILKHEVYGDTMKIDALKYQLYCRNIAPDDTTVWFTDTVTVANYLFYNSPKGAKAVECIKNGNYRLYIATGFEESEEELAEKSYQFVYNELEPSTSRFLVNPNYKVKYVRTLWQYDDFDCYSLKTEYDSTKTVEPYINVGLTIGKGIYANEYRYKGAVKMANGVTHALAGSTVDYLVSIDPKGGKLLEGSVSYGKQKVEAEVSGNFISSTFPNNEQPGTYNDITVNATLRFTFDKTQVFDIPTTFKVPSERTFILHQKPTFPEMVEEYNKQLAYNDELKTSNNLIEVNMSIVPGQGGNNKWEYIWSTETDGKVGEGAELEYLSLNPSLVSGNVKKYTSEKVTLEYCDRAPDGTEWIKGSFEYPVNVYNTPSAPVSLKLKGENNTSNIYIATMDPVKFGSTKIDDVVKEREYVFIYGNGDEVIMEKSAQDPEKQSRWCNYTGYAQNNPWVETVWRYPAINGLPAFECHSTRCYSTTSSRGEGEGTTGIEEIETSGNIEKIFTMDGKLLPNTDIKSLDPGQYIIEQNKDSQVSRVKIVIK